MFLPDTQFYSASYPDTFTAQTQWCVDNAVAEGIKAVMHMGDMVDDVTIEQQLINAKTAMDILQDADLPNLVSMGNHDYGALFYTYFPSNRYAGEAWFNGDTYGDASENNYITITVGDYTWLLMTLEYNSPAQSALMAWAEAILEANTDKHVIITTHSYLYDNKIRTIPTWGNGEGLWYDFLKAHPNVLLIGSGHIHGISNRIDRNNGGGWVNSFLSDYQSDDNGGNGYLRIVYFKPNSRMMLAKTYSPTLDAFYEDASNYYAMKY